MMTAISPILFGIENIAFINLALGRLEINRLQIVKLCIRGNR